ncbi:MAG: Holliday junction resolvase RuvX [Rickettsiales bacterium]|nr:Holliday junction resolvase RuvX [Rickettsiales bacterium]
MQPLNAQEFKEKTIAEGRLLSIDHGKKRIGLAISDISREYVNPLETLAHPKFAVNAQTLAKMVSEHRVAGFIVGYPLNMDGTEGPRCQSVRQFVRSLEAYVDIPMLLWDERLSSDIAHEQMLEGGLRGAQRAGKVDKLAAGAILQSYLETL